MIVASPSPDRAKVFSMCFPEEIPDYDLPMDLGDGFDGVILPDTYMDEMDMIGTGRSVRICGLPLSFDTMSEFVTRFDDISDGNNDMSIFEYLPVSQHFPLIAPPAPTTHVCDVDDMGDTDDPLSGQSECDSNSDTEDRKVTPISGSIDLIDFRAPDQTRELRIDSFLSSDERSRLIDLLSLKDDFPLPHIDMLVDSTAGHSMLSFMDGFSGYNQILMALEDMEKTSFITEWGTYCYRIMPFGLKNARATYQRVVTTLFHDMMHRDVEVYVDDMIVKSRYRCTFGVTYGKLLGHIVSECGIEVDPENIRAILDMPAPRTEREIRGFLDMALGCMLAQLDDSRKERAIYYLSKRMLEYEYRYIMIERLYLALVWATKRLRHYVTEYSILLVSRLDTLRYLFDRLVLTDHLASLPVSDDRPIDDDFLNEQFVSVTNITGWSLYFDGAANQSGFGIGMHHRSGDCAKPWSQTVGDPRGFQLGYSTDLRVENQFANALSTLASVIEILVGVTVRPLLIETRSVPAYCCLIRILRTRMSYLGIMTFTSSCYVVLTLSQPQPRIGEL
ncbi:Retrovirus-related Pol polyprotein from transposon 297 [Vitis vinifera]|uniref:Retrovirus-related Pol polyprotein from transposon 297 n=1 Tax=Vitis vinifera TaxID=29760 RepID=A0A438HUW9_VITVI|nr:Retrovirus-related Pol polyprotein from transposon 297 [Vitis vinifera]